MLLLAACAPSVNAPLPASAGAASAKSQDLLYATGGCLGTCVFAYPSGALVGSLGVGGDGGGDCADANGNVYIADNAQIFEYAHGGTKPLLTLTVPGTRATGCSVDPSTASLAVVFAGTTGDIAIFPQGSTAPALYTSGVDAAYCGYNEQGDLFVDGFGTGNVSALAVLRSGSSGFTNIALKSALGLPGQVQWDGSYMTYESVTKGDVSISRLDIDGSSASVVGTTTFNMTAPAFQSWIYDGHVFIPYGSEVRSRHQSRIGVWMYPAGGRAESQIRVPESYENSVSFRGVAYSSAPNI